jgi:hypothetical protein
VECDDRAAVRQGEADVIICSCNEFPTAWVFGYNTRRFLQDMQLLASFVGNGPVVEFCVTRPAAER